MTRQLFAGLALLLSSSLCSTPAAAQACVAATPPAPVAVNLPPKLAEPPKPACIAANRCRNPEVEAYNKLVEAYNTKLPAHEATSKAEIARVNAYITELNRYAATAEAYIVCERKRLTEALADR